LKASDGNTAPATNALLKLKGMAHKFSLTPI
jgi:hypothetical protein